ncbi:unnamed protein product [Lepeophtheirus salmonis]|uniref:(salmon louse) hypothetical protein n=1 Tax=Lepeophtheirus salmonis TaxID=72036 RepID=A0A7R8CJE2_LEPSM|nr:unnamed protein product [Lepeophtheirus salmonis]CAF2839405.1 unnamed protein product [Lepeophtheirus salmonis]
MFANMVFDDDLGKFNSRAEGDSGISTAEGSFNSSNGEVIHLYSIGTNTDLDNQVEKMDIDCGYVSYQDSEFHLPRLNSLNSDRTGTTDDLIRDLHIYLIPPEAWQNGRSLAQIDVVNNSISMGFIRVSEDTTLVDLRPEIISQLEDDVFSQDYVLLEELGDTLLRFEQNKNKS